VFVLSTTSLGERISYRQLVLWKDNFLSMDVWGFNSERLMASAFVVGNISADGLMMRVRKHRLFCNCTLDLQLRRITQKLSRDNRPVRYH
jgi:hypothetical protein